MRCGSSVLLFLFCWFPDVGDSKLIQQISLSYMKLLIDFKHPYHFGNKIIMIVAYVPPGYDKNQFVNELDNELEILSKYKILVVLTADFNINVLAENHLQQSHVNTITANCFELLIRNATRNTGVAGKCFDHLIGRNIEKPYVRILENEYFSDHCPVLLQLKSKQFNLIFSSFRDMSFLNNGKVTNDFLKSF